MNGPFAFESADTAGRPHFIISCSGFNPHSINQEEQAATKKRMLGLLVRILVRVFLIQDIDKLLREMFRDEAALDRSIDFTSSLVTTGNVLGHSCQNQYQSVG